MSERQAKIANLLKEHVATFVLHEANTDPMITITRVDVSPDLKRAIVFFTTIPDGREADAQIFLKRCGSDLRQYLKQKASFKRIPHFDFMIDAGERHRQHIDEVMQKIKEEKEEQ
jgi:ribosome-binding factor A